MADDPDVLARLENAAEAAMRSAVPSASECERTNAAIAARDAMLRELGAMTEAEVLRAAKEAAYAAAVRDVTVGTHSPGAPIVCMTDAAVDAAAGLLCARERAEVARLRALYDQETERLVGLLGRAQQRAEAAERERDEAEQSNAFRGAALEAAFAQRDEAVAKWRAAEQRVTELEVAIHDAVHKKSLMVPTVRDRLESVLTRPAASGDTHEYEPRDCGGTCLVCGCGKSAHVTARPEEG